MKNKKLKIYIASPYSNGDQALNVRRSFEVYDELINKGFFPYTPLANHFIHILFPQSYEKWLQIDIEWLLVCDCVLRLEGESKGADKEVKVAKQNNIPVFYSTKEILEYYYKNKIIKEGKK